MDEGWDGPKVRPSPIRLFLVAVVAAETATAAAAANHDPDPRLGPLRIGVMVGGTRLVSDWRRPRIASLRALGL